ncbi:glycosyltransferase family 2 protein [Pseudoflavitalea rhizosphaerae]|uniref:glycosyltransferase family 2 protein n=1 Tax=Pseudoflavitalea rhizosphaerae TaxID=1884793 RepID=UPI000F8E4FA2|nr:glycosyltransferase family 2 protein [Pseudoflavitalea rhizosphaerae]
MSSPVLISICIPAYKRVELLQRLLQSIEVQTLRDFEVIVTDDSPDSSVQELCLEFAASFPLYYYRNEKALGSPENWNESIRLAKGQWIKIMHDDDAFAGPDSLRKLYELTQNGAGFVFSGYHIIEGGQISETHAISAAWVKRLRRDPRLLMQHNVIGHPSVVLHRNQKDILYDQRMKWMVDIDFYIRYLQSAPFNYTVEPLINIGWHEEQITRSVFTDKQVVVPENLLLLDKLGVQFLNNLKAYDHFWRLLRNYEVKNAAELQSLSPVPVPASIKKMLSFQRIFPRVILKWGPASKVSMLLSWWLNR